MSLSCKTLGQALNMSENYKGAGNLELNPPLETAHRKSQSEAEMHQWHQQTQSDLCLTYLPQHTALNKNHTRLQGNIFFKVFLPPSPFFPKKVCCRCAICSDSWSRGCSLSSKSKHGAKLPQSSPCLSTKSVKPMSNTHFFLSFLTETVSIAVNPMTHRTNLKGLRVNACLMVLSLLLLNRGFGKALQDAGATKAPFFLLWRCI